MELLAEFGCDAAQGKVMDAAELREQADMVAEQQAEVLKEKLAAERPAPEETLSFYVAECLEFTFAGEFHDHLTMEEALEVYDKIPSERMNADKARAKAGLNSVELGDAAHNAAAAKRAEELATTYSYVRPNGQRDFTVFAENGIGDVSVGENYLAGVSTPDSAMDQWMNLDFARERILNADATTVSVGHYEGGAYGNYWVLIFSYPENSHTDDFRQEVLDLVNVERAKYGLTPLVMGDANLTAAAQKRAEEIATVNSHTRPDGSKCFTVLKEYGVTAAPTGENAAWGSVSPQEVVDAWMQSEGHRANILNPEARAMGVGYYYNSSSTWGHQWIQIFTK